MGIKEKLLHFNLVIDNEYLDKYVELVQDNIGRKFEKFSMHRHHIIPRYYFKYNNIECDNTTNNIVNLKYTEHVLAHFYLFKCSAIHYYEFCNAEALRRLIHIIPENEMGVLKSAVDVDYVETVRRRLFSEQLKGHKVSETTKLKISKSNKQTRLEGKYKYVHKDGVETCVPEKLLEEFLSNGWKLGSIRKRTAWNKGMKLNNEETKSLQRNAKLGGVHINKNGEDKLIDKSFLDYYLSDGWSLGVSQKTKEAISKGSIGKAGTFSGRHHSQDTKESIGKANSGGKYVNKDDIVRHVSMENLDAYLSDGWSIGNLNSPKGTFRWMNNGVLTVMVKTELVDEFLSNGYVFGRLH